MIKLELKVPPLILTILFAGCIWASSSLLPGFHIEIPGRFLIAGIFFLLSAVIGLAGIYQFRNAMTTVNPMMPGKTSSLVTSGVYRLSRNPMYLGVLLVLCSWAVILSNLIGFLFLPIFILYMNQFQIKPEERVLSEKFGADFRKYQTTVRRWL